MTRRSYDQFCGLAGALDLVGERWTLLVVRELMTGPQRYTDLAEALHGIGTSLLAQRLQRLEDHGVVRRSVLPAPTPATVYELTASGEDLGRALMPLVAWGLRHALPPKPTPEMRVRPAWSLLAITHGIDPEKLAGINATYEFQVDGGAAHLRISDGVAAVAAPYGAVDATVRIGAETISAVGSGRMSVLEATAAGMIEVDGDEAAIAALVGVFEG